jgi:hypothetical protein
LLLSKRFDRAQREPFTTESAERNARLPAISSAASATTATSAASTAAISTVASTAASAATTTTALGFGTSFIDVDGASTNLRSVQSSDSFIAVFIARHFHKAESAGATSVTVRHDADTIHLAVAFEDLPQFVFIGVEA